jgi:NADH-quinone oxidoreductase subunit F
MSEIDLALLQDALAVHTLQGQTALIPALQTAQQIFGYIPAPVAAEVGHLLGVPLAEVYGVIDFYSMLYHQPVGERILRVCTDPACALAGGETILAELCHHLDISPGQTSADGAITVERSPCLGLCDHAPAVLLDDAPLGPVDPFHPEDLLQPAPARTIGVIDGTIRILTARCTNGTTTSLAEYLAAGGYEALKIALAASPQAVIDTVKASGLVGRGGAAFPAGLKWESAAAAPGEPKYLVCNADESEPGTFKDRVLMEHDPAAFASGASHGYIYIRGEYPFVYQIMSAAVESTRTAGYLGKDILGSGFDFDIELRLGAGAYICGEETALFESIEGNRGFPRIKPPFQPPMVSSVSQL